ncbi:NADPH-dependent FMN reductase [Candidatus Uabimicrobium amorphum]|uniref:Flavoprotein n=1 Tax=Uabimicrobium amorphum TaxID=2596890 RepID=A0A5S9F3Z0_UABAM|nr:NAD(P)H-dependent oxidoreductase [Candidatus Uabimicrobium amorphum]BBM84751.1 flavoprotein [Candidatus Uabimicrobium amorphum]
MDITIICGSQRVQSESGKLALFLQEKIAELFPETQTNLFDLGKNPLPLWNEGVWQGTDEWKTIWHPIAETLNSSDGIILISPEYGGMVPPALKNFLLLCGGKDIAHKPGLIVGVSSGRGGSYPIAELRTTGYKNNRLCWIPDHVIVRDIANFNKNPSEYQRDIDRMEYSLKMLNEYAKALTLVRNSGTIDLDTYPFGM